MHFSPDSSFRLGASEFFDA